MRPYLRLIVVKLFATIFATVLYVNRIGLSQKTKMTPKTLRLFGYGVILTFFTRYSKLLFISFWKEFVVSKILTTLIKSMHVNG